MTIFASLVDALHAGYEILGPIQGGYLLRLTRPDATESYGILTLKTKPQAPRNTAFTKHHESEPSTSGARRVDACLADFSLSFDYGVAIVKVKGDINLNNVAAFKAVVDCAETTGSSAIVVALTMTKHVCRRAYRILSGLEVKLERVGGCVCISCDPNCPPRQTMTRLAVPFPIFDNVDDAIATLGTAAYARQTNEFHSRNRSKPN